MDVVDDDRHAGEEKVNNNLGQLMASATPFLAFTVSIFTTIGLTWLLFTKFYYITLLYFIWFVYDEFILNTPRKGGRLFPWVRRLSFWRYLADYFPVRLHKTADLDSTNNYIIAAHPHGYFQHGTVCTINTEACNFSQLFPGIRLHILTIDNTFKWPFLRELYTSCGLASVSARSILYKLTKLGKGQAVYLEPGGIKEIPLAVHEPDYHLNIINRKGFIRMALKTGAAVVPMFKFGEHRIFESAKPKKGTIADWFIAFSRAFSGVNVPYITGRFSVIVPFQRPINHVVGAPIYFDKASLSAFCSSEEELVDDCHRQYLGALRKLFDDNKNRFGDSDSKLIFT